jgi:hypothetical protein
MSVAWSARAKSLAPPNVALQSTFSFSCGGVRCGLVRRSVRRACSGAKLNATELGALGSPQSETGAYLTFTEVRMSAGVEVDIGILSFAITSRDLEHYLDLQTGDVIPRFDDAPDDDEEIATALVETPDRFVLVEPVSSEESYRWMERFAASQTDDEIREALFDALDRPKPFRRFKDALERFPEVREEWFHAHDQRVLEYAQAWLAAEDLNVQLVTPRGAVSGGGTPADVVAES